MSGIIKDLFDVKTEESDISFTYLTKVGVKVNVYSCNLPENPKTLKRQHEILKTKITTGVELCIYDHRYNCHGLTFISRLGFVGIADYKIKQIVLPGRSSYEYNEDIMLEDLQKALSDYDKVDEISNTDVDTINFKQVKVGDIVLYLKDNKYSHSCIIYQINNTIGNIKEIKVISKFGQYGEFLHNLLDPFVIQIYGKHLEIWQHKNI